ncbi:MAG: GntR family transcriptional regulator [Alphaproteobacteria bacterium]|nr:GntR family transcriptional regulator [Alphaproteobacteria bacterium]
MADPEISVGGARSRFRTPLYHQIYLILRQRIADGDFGADGLVPGEQDVAECYRVSRITAKRALDELAADGVVVRERGRGTRVAPDAARIRVSTAASGGMDPLIAMGGETDVSVLGFDYVPAPADVATALALPAGSPVQRAVRVRSVEGAAFSHLTTHVPEAIGRCFDRDDLAATPLLALFARVGVTPTSAEQSVSATLADAVVAERLGMDVGAPLLRVRRVVKDEAGCAIEHLVALYRSDRYRMAMTLSREPAREGRSPDAVESVSSRARGGWTATGTMAE